MLVLVEDAPSADTYNSCVQTCQEPLRKARLETEYQLREWQLNLNDCFFMCKNQEVAGFDQQAPCLQRCFRVHSDMLGHVSSHLHGLYSSEL